MQMLGVYRDFAYNVLAIPVLTGQKSEKEKFAGAEAHLHDGSHYARWPARLQMGTSPQPGPALCQGALTFSYLDRDGQAEIRLADQLGRLARA